MKNILLENMLRFGTKNLSEHQLQLLTEAVQVANLSLSVPAQNAPNQNIPFTIGPLGNKAADEYTGLLGGLTIGGISTNSLKNQKLTGEYITGEISLTNTDANYLQLRDAILKVPANFLGTTSDFNRYNAILVRKKDPNNANAPGRDTVLLGSIKVQQTATPK